MTGLLLFCLKAKILKKQERHKVMILHIEGDINRYYVQTLSMIFFPGATFAPDEEPGENVPELYLKLEKTDVGYRAQTKVFLGGKSAQAEHECESREDLSDERCRKVAVGASVTAALGSLLEYRSSWGILTGVRPSKVATEMLSRGISKTKTKRLLVQDYLVSAKKAALATEVALNEQKIIGEPQTRDCSIYVSIPFCPSRCAYCSFVSYTSKKLLSLIPEYVERLSAEVKEAIAAADRCGLNIKTVYIGGGTPSILEPDLLEKLMSSLAQALDGREIEEFTFEAGRPDTITAEKLAIAKKYGADRISVNPQTLCPEVLSGIGRSHTVEDFYRAYSIARETGIDCINTDLIAGLPGDTFTRFATSMDGILALRPENVTVHTFCVKRSATWRQSAGIYSMRGGDAGKCVDYSQIKAQQAGYKPYYMYRQKNTVGNYENVGFSLDGKEGRYNIYMMEEIHSIIAIGAGAVSKFVCLKSPETGKPSIKRLFNAKYPYEYLKAESIPNLVDAMEAFCEEFI